MSEHHQSHAHDKHHRKPAHPHAAPPVNAGGKQRAGSQSMPVVHDELTLYTEDGKWKANLKAYKSWWAFYADIGAEVDVYERRETRDIWGNKKTDWVATPASIFMMANFQGNVAPSPQVPQNPEGGPPNGGLGSYEQSMEFKSSHGELKLWAAGFFTTTISVSGERTTPAGATLDINSVVAEIEIATPSGTMRGTVGASSYFSDNSAWG